MRQLIPILFLLLLLTTASAVLPAWAADTPSTAPTAPAAQSTPAPVHDRFAQWEKEIGAFEKAFDERPKRTLREAIHTITRVRVRDLLPSAGGGGFLSRSVTLAEQVTSSVAAAAAALGVSPEEVTELLGRADGLSAIGRVEQAQAARILAERGRSLAEIEVIVPEVGKLATLHATDIAPLAADFEALLSLGRLSADEAPRIAEEVHVLAATSGLTVPDTIGAFVTLLGGAQAREPQTADP